MATIPGLDVSKATPESRHCLRKSPQNNTDTWPRPFLRQAGRLWGENSTGTFLALGKIMANPAFGPRSDAVNLPGSGPGQRCLLFVPIYSPYKLLLPIGHEL